MMGKIAPLGLLEPVPGRENGPRKVRNFVYLQYLWSMFNSVGICNFTAGPVWSLPLNKWPEVVYAATGWESSLFELCKLGERTVTLAKAEADAERIRGRAEAEATRTYAAAHQKDPAFFELSRTLETYKRILDDKTTVLLSGDSELLKYLMRGPALSPTPEKKPAVKGMPAAQPEKK